MDDAALSLLRKINVVQEQDHASPAEAREKEACASR
jgi:hypothetical protein